MSTISVNVKITKEEVYEEVRKIAGYVAAKGEDNGESYDRVKLTEAQHESLDRFWDMCVTTVSDVLKPYIDIVTDMSSTYDVTLEMPSNWNETLKEDFVNTIKNYIVHTTASMWMRIVNKDEQSWGDDAASFIAQIKRKLYDRIRPKRPGRECDCGCQD